MVSEGVKLEEEVANVFRGSKEVTLMISTPEKYCLQKTSLLFSCDEYHMRCCGSLMGLVERAICKFSPVIGSLNGWMDG